VNPGGLTAMIYLQLAFKLSFHDVFRLQKTPFLDGGALTVDELDVPLLQQMKSYVDSICESRQSAAHRNLPGAGGVAQKSLWMSGGRRHRRLQQRDRSS
jgi:hypothetical protein